MRQSVLVSFAAAFLAIGILSASNATAQQPAQSLQFEVATIKPSNPKPGVGSSFSTGGPGGQVRLVNMPLKQWIEMALSVREDALKVPSWLDTSRFDLDAKLPAGEPASAEMLKALLIERFGLKWHEEPQTVPGYELITDKKVLLKPATQEERQRGLHGSGSGPTMINGANMSMPDLAKALEKVLGTPVVDATHLSDGFDISLRWRPSDDTQLAEERRNAKKNGIDVESLPSTIFNAVQEQLGLRLQSIKVPSNVIVVDQINRQPTEN